MATGSGKNQDGNQAKEPVEREESNTAAAAAEPPPPAPPSDGLQERAHGSPEAGGQNPSVATAAEAAAAAQPKGSEIVAAPSWRHDAGGKSPLPPRAASVSRASEPKSAAGNPLLPPRASGSKGKKPMADAEVVNSGRDVRNKWRDMREGRMHMKEVFEELLEESKANAEMDQEDDTEGTTMQQEQVKSATVWPENYRKGSIWRKLLDRIGIADQSSRTANPEVNYEVKSTTIWPESCYMRSLIRKCRLLSRQDMLVLTVILAVAFLPSAEAFRRFETVQDAANKLVVLPYVDMDNLRNRLQEESPAAGFSFGSWFRLIAFGACLVGGLASGFVDPGQEPAPPVEGRPPLAVREINTDSTATLVLIAVTLVTVVVVVVRCLGGR